MNKQEIQHEIDRVEKVVNEASTLLHNLSEELKKTRSHQSVASFSWGKVLHGKSSK